MKDLLGRLSEAGGPSGHEDAVRNIIAKEIEGFVDEMRVDALGNLIARKGRGPKRIMFAAHMDEVGVIATYIDDKGFIRFSNIGGVTPFTLLGERVVFGNGTIGVFGVEKLDNIKDIKMEHLYIDIGTSSKEETEKLVRIGDFASYLREFRDLGKRVAGKALDDRAGCAVMIEALKRLGDPGAEVYFVFTVQEEVGLRGAKTSAYGVNPDIAVAIDVTATGDTPNGMKMAVELGKGAAIKVKDMSIMVHPMVKRILTEAAEEDGIPYQYEVLESGGTDSGAIHLTREGVPSGVISIPCRYIHTPSEMIDMGDFESAVRLLLSSVKKIAGMER